MTITAQMVKELREATGAGMMDAKKALVEVSGDFEAAVDWLRKKGMAKAEKKSSRTAADGMVYVVTSGNKGAMVEVNSETDFVAKNEGFQAFVKELGQMILETGTTDVDAINATTFANGKSVKDTLVELIAKIGENMTIRRAETLTVENGVVSGYMHMGGKIGVMVAVEGSDDADTARNIAMHVAAANPQFLDRSAVDPEVLAREKQVYIDRAKASGKPDNIVEKIVEGQVNKFCEEICLVDQAFVMDTDRRVGQVVSEAGGQIKAFSRFVLGEGIEKEEADFAAEVAAAVNG